VGVAERLRAAVRVEDTVARMSGDEFIVLVEGPKTLEAVNAMGQNIRRKLAEGFLVEDQLIRLRTSTGIAMFPEDGSTPEALIKKADIQMYADKQARTARRHEGQEG
jgi:diguanylate cyclase (GGDEF)-like protein